MGRRLFLCGLLAGCASSPAYRAAPATTRAAPDRSSPTGPTRDARPVAGFAPPPSAPAREATSDRPLGETRGDADGVRPAPAQLDRPAAATAGTSAQSINESSTVSIQGADDDGEHTVREARIGAQVQRIREEQIRLATNPGICHDVCFAAGSICLAAQEVCRLTGDRDVRCERARTACADAGRQRDGTCPVCPPTH